jgi:GNAT superfamily N-acetyltransferase
VPYIFAQRVRRGGADRRRPTPLLSRAVRQKPLPHPGPPVADVQVRAAAPADVSLIHGLIVALADYERAPGEVTGTQEMLAHELFGPQPSVEGLIAERGGRPVGFALFYGTFSSWRCAPGIWLEDLFVPPEHRRYGVGAALLTELARIAVVRGCARLEWTALNWNEPALAFYARLGAERLTEWDNHRLEGESLRRLATRRGA